MPTYKIGVIPGDGIGPEIVDAALAVLDAVVSGAPFSVDYVRIDAGAATFQRTGTAMSPHAVATVRDCDATLKGPVGLPEVRHADGTEAGVLGGVLRIGLDLYANVRPIQLLPGVESPLRVEPGSIDYVIVRENTEGIYASRGKGVGGRWAVADTVLVTRPATERIVRYAFELALRRSGAPLDRQRRVTCVDKANVLRSFWFFREVFGEVAGDYPAVEAECLYADAAAQALIMAPERFDVIVTENFLGDILSDLGGGTVGGVGLCPSGNIGNRCAYFEPIHGSAPAIAGQSRANPIGQILAVAVMLDYLNEPAAARRVRGAVTDGLAGGGIRLRPDGSAVGGPAAVARAVVDAVSSSSSSGS